MAKMDNAEITCPLCLNSIDHCQCLYSIAKPDSGKRLRVVLDHLYMFSDKQIKHIVNLEREWCSEYDDVELNQTLRQIEIETGKKAWQDCIK